MKSAQLLTGSINLSKIDKNKIVVGKTGKFLPIAVWINEEADQFGNHASIQQGQSKEERESGNKKVYLGNLKRFEKDAPQPLTEEDKNDLPFWWK